jgi:threonine/homoserine/homoserine lactone efflux protein
MLIDLLPAFALFALVSSITPGPNNTMLLASGVNFGFLRTIPHALGISLGFMLLVVAVGLGLGEIFTAAPWTYTALRWIGAAYLLYLAWCIATSGRMSEAGEHGGTPMTFLGAAAFQWVNPKAWVMAVGAITTYVRVRLGRFRQCPAQCTARAALVAPVQLGHGGVAGAVAVSVVAESGAGVTASILRLIPLPNGLLNGAQSHWPASGPGM